MDTSRALGAYRMEGSEDKDELLRVEGIHKASLPGERLAFYHNETHHFTIKVEEGVRETTTTPNGPTWLSSCIMHLRLIMHDNPSHHLRLQERGKSLNCRYEHMHDSRRRRRISSGAMLRIRQCGGEAGS